MTTLDLLCIDLLSRARTTDERTLNGENLSPSPSVGVFFNGFGEDEETNETTDTNVEKYKIVIHKESNRAKFTLPSSNRVQLGMIYVDLGSEVEINAIFDLQDNRWHVNSPMLDENSAMTQGEVLSILKKSLAKLKSKNIKPITNAWPFAVAPIPVKTKK